MADLKANNNLESNNQEEPTNSKPKRKEKQARIYEHYMKQRQSSENLAYWKQIQNELKKLEDQEFTIGEIAEGLAISRQTYSEFMSCELEKKKEEGKTLPIYRENVLALWDFLTQQEKMDLSKNNKKQQTLKLNREKLKERGSENFLKAFGFISETQDSILDHAQFKIKKNYRIVARLSSPWIREEDSWKLEEAILNEILKENRSLQQSKIDGEDVERWLKTKYKSIVITNTEKKFLSLVRKYATAGKWQFDEVELFELYQSISENEVLRNQGKKTVKIRIVDCEFRSLNESFKDLMKSEDENNSDLISDILKIGIETESKLRKTFDIHDQLNENIFLAFQPVKEAKITYRLGDNETYLYWVYRSSSTQIENMLVALKQGLGYSLELVGLSMRALGNESSSLARVSVALRDNVSSKTYQGLWVDFNTITSVLQAVVLAVEAWLSEQIKLPEDYYEICRCSAKVLNDFEEAVNALYDYRLDNINNTIGAKGYADKILKIGTEKEILSLLEKNQCFAPFYKDLLERVHCVAKLIKARLAHIEGNLSEAKEIILDIDNNYKDIIEPSHTPISLLHTVEKMIDKFFVGDQEFLVGRLWRREGLNLDYYENQIEKYISSEKKSTSLHFNLYLSLSELYGNFGRLELYSCKKGERKDLEKAIDSFLKASYFSLKIDNRQRLAHWLAHISRASSRLGDKDKAIQYSLLAKKIVDRAISPRDSNEYCESISAEVKLADGEKSLLIDEEPKEALKAFLEALKGSLHLNFSRLIADSLYGVARAAQLLSKQSNGPELTEYFGSYRQENQDEFTNIQAGVITKKTINFLLEINEKVTNEKVTWDFIYTEFKREAKQIWHDWAAFDINDNTQKIEHPFEQKIENGTFLNKLI